MEGLTLFDGFVLGGFDCASHAWRDGRRVDSIAGTRHDQLAARDYALLKRHGFGGARDGLRWHLIEPSPGRYDWSSWLPMLRAARDTGLPVAWDLLHWGFPLDLDLMSPAFVDRAAAYATAAARLYAAEFDTPPMWVPVNEISFWAWAGGVSGGWPPYNAVDGDTLKAQLVRTAVAMSHAVRAVDPRAVLITAEPLIAVHSSDGSEEARAAAATYEASQFTSTDILLGRAEPEWGGAETLIDVVGCNYYPLNQFVLNGCCVPVGDFSHRPVADLLLGLWERYRKPVVITETGCEGDFRAAWFKYVFESAAAANARGADIRGVCIYPVLDYPGWEDARHCPCGAFNGLSDQREGYAPLLDEIARQLAAMPG